jgi:hypothetical protein
MDAAPGNVDLDGVAGLHQRQRAGPPNPFPAVELAKTVSRIIVKTPDGTVNIITCTPLLPRRSAFARLEHDPEKWIPVFGKDHAPTIN